MAALGWLINLDFAAGVSGKDPTKLLGTVNIESLMTAVPSVKPTLDATPNIEPVLEGEPEPC